jgi:hypothetical protein
LQKWSLLPAGSRLAMTCFCTCSPLGASIMCPTHDLYGIAGSAFSPPFRDSRDA